MIGREEMNDDSISQLYMWFLFFYNVIIHSVLINYFMWMTKMREHLKEFSWFWFCLG